MSKIIIDYHKFTSESKFISSSKNYNDIVNYRYRTNDFSSTLNFLYENTLITPYPSIITDKFNLYELNFNFNHFDIITDITCNSDKLLLGSYRTIIDKDGVLDIEKEDQLRFIEIDEDYMWSYGHNIPYRKLYALFYHKEEENKTNYRKHIKYPDKITFSCFGHFLSKDKKKEFLDSNFETKSERYLLGLTITKKERIFME